MNIADKCPCLGCMERTVGCHSSCEKYKSYMKESEERKKAIKKYLEKDTSYRDYSDDKIARARREAAEIGLNTAETWMKTDGGGQMFKALIAVVYYTLHMKRPGKGFDSKRGIISFHNDLVEMMNENITDYNFKSDDDGVFVCNYWLKQLGVNLDELTMPINFELKWGGKES